LFTSLISYVVFSASRLANALAKMPDLVERIEEALAPTKLKLQKPQVNMQLQSGLKYSSVADKRLPMSVDKFAALEIPDEEESKFDVYSR
jgi:hypothetical protein